MACSREPSANRTLPDFATSEQVSRAMTGMAAAGAVSAWAAPGHARTLRAYSKTACWNPPHVPRNGRDDSRAYRIAASAPSALAYGLAGTHQIAAYDFNVSAATPTAVVWTHSGLIWTRSHSADRCRASG